MKTRPISPTDFSEVLRLNEESVQYLSFLSRDGLEKLHKQAALQWVVEDHDKILGFVIVLIKGSDYGSINYQWFDQRHDNFLYVDRIVVARKTQARGAGSLLYQKVFEFAQDHQFDTVCCEYDIDPPNAGSAAFHRKFGFFEVARQAVANGTKLVSLQMALAAGPITQPHHAGRSPAR